jgi:hypothetical protein
MKRIIPLFITICISSLLSAQTTFNYTYDDAGNRVLRQVVELRSMQSNSNDSIALQESTTLGEMQISIMPNPTAGLLQINISNLPANAEGGITLWDLQSKEILKQTGIFANNPINLSQQPKGTYLMQIRVGKQRSEWKVVKE